MLENILIDSRNFRIPEVEEAASEFVEYKRFSRRQRIRHIGRQTDEEIRKSLEGARIRRSGRLDDPSYTYPPSSRFGSGINW